MKTKWSIAKNVFRELPIEFTRKTFLLHCLYNYQLEEEKNGKIGSFLSNDARFFFSDCINSIQDQDSFNTYLLLFLYIGFVERIGNGLYKQIHYPSKDLTLNEARKIAFPIYPKDSEFNQRSM